MEPPVTGQTSPGYRKEVNMIEYKPLSTVEEASDISGTEPVKRLQQDVEDGVTGCRSLSYKGNKRKGDQDVWY